MKTKVTTALHRAIDQLPHPDFAAIADAPVEKLSAMDAMTRQEGSVKKANPVRRFAPALACCALLLVLGLGWCRENLVVASRITLDVNPSFSITASRRDRVLTVTPLNGDAIALLADEIYRGKTVDETVEGLIARMANSRYLTAEHNSILLSVRAESETHTRALEKELSRHIQTALAPTAIHPHIVLQMLQDNDEEDAETERYQVSPGKVQLARQAQARLGGSLETLTALPLGELLALTEKPERLDDDIDDIDDIDEDEDDDKDDKDGKKPTASRPGTVQSKDDEADKDDDTDEEPDTDDKDEKPATKPEKPTNKPGSSSGKPGKPTGKGDSVEKPDAVEKPDPP
ncbi:MAG: hypothetical protein RR092_05040, partial [Oscillospiraceae bacterium]